MGPISKDIDQDRDGGVAPVVGALQKFTVNSIGIVLTKDVIRYQSVIDGWKIPELSEQFQILRDWQFVYGADRFGKLVGHRRSIGQYEAIHGETIHYQKSRFQSKLCR